MSMYRQAHYSASQTESKSHRQAKPMVTVREHWRAFWRSGPENLYTFIWWAVFTAATAGLLFVGAWLLSRISGVSPVIVAIASRWEDRFLAIFVALLFVALATWLTRRRIVQNQRADSVKPMAAKESVKSVEEKPVNLRSLFDSDFPNTASVQSVLKIKDTQPVPEELYEIPFRVCVDFDARSQFLAFYIAANVRTRRVCLCIGAHYQDAIQLANRLVGIHSKHPSDTAETQLKDAVFSGRIFRLPRIRNDIEGKGGARGFLQTSRSRSSISRTRTSGPKHEREAHKASLESKWQFQLNRLAGDVLR
jgi:hypothetical protein